MGHPAAAVPPIRAVESSNSGGASAERVSSVVTPLTFADPSFSQRAYSGAIPADPVGGCPVSLDSSSRQKSFSSVFELMQSGVQEKTFPGAVCCVAQGNKILFFESIGHISYSPLSEEVSPAPVGKGTVYDVDSLTSSIITTSLAMKAVEEGRIQLKDRVSKHVHGFGVFGKSVIRIVDLLKHQSGLPAAESLYQKQEFLREDLAFGTPIGRGVAQQMLTLINRLNTRTAPGGQFQYSEIAMLLLGFLLEDLWGRRIDQLASHLLFRPLNIQRSGFVDHGLIRQGKLKLDVSLIAPSEECPWRKRVLRGEVRDENTWAIGGISGEAGLFANAFDVTVLLQALLASYGGRFDAFMTSQVVRTFFDVPQEEELAGHGWALGWARAQTAFGVEAPFEFSRSLGATSGTGCAVWFDPESSLSMVFLSNRTMPQRSNRKIAQFLPRFIKSVWQAVL